MTKPARTPRPRLVEITEQQLAFVRGVLEGLVGIAAPSAAHADASAVDALL